MQNTKIKSKSYNTNIYASSFHLRKSSAMGYVFVYFVYFIVLKTARVKLELILNVELNIMSTIVE